ncbi:pectinesterase family protein [Paenibacillus rigui]|uniref:Probable pectate lyase C n=1 Tax=Paenibacillus rigui TaxID=554312 RepID=A0A229UU96_9BACL|nr:pectinesterase family protein [Paenibacillus rigui]OXM86954.1 hypothetical protein CF651_07370 [Paenibacillus rigui]
MAGQPIAASPSATSTGYTDSGLTSGTNYDYVVQSKNVGGISANSTPLHIMPVSPLASPTGLSAVAGNAKVDLTWSSVTGSTYYTVKRSTLSGRSYSIIASNVTAPAFTDATVENGSTYFYVVTASNAQTESMNSDQAGGTPFLAQAGTPSIPGEVTGEAGENEISLKWSAVSDAASYNVKRAVSVMGPYTTIANVSATGYTDTGVTNGITYYYAVSAVNANGEGGSSAAVIATPAHVIVVSKDGTGDFKTVQAAVDSVPAGNTARQVIYIRNGVYYEKISVPGNKPYLSFVGESRDGTILTYDDYSAVVGTGNSYSVSVGANNFMADNLTIRNTAFPRSVVGPAVALYVTADRALFTNIRLAGFQDTLYVNSGRQYFKNAIIEGDVDWIFGNATAVFDNSEIKFVGNGGGHTTAASTDQLSAYGYVFLNSKLTRGTSSMKNAVTVGAWDPSWDIDNTIAATNGSVDLGRPWRAYANVKYINTWMDAHIRAAGWDNWGNAANETTASYGEYNTSGPGANPKGRYKWTSQLTSTEANLFTVQNVMKGTDGWDPTLSGVLPLKSQSVKPAAPTGITAALGYLQISLSWNAAGMAQSYTVYRSETPGGPYMQIASGIPAASFADTSAASGMTYYYAVSAVNAFGESALSNEVMASSVGTFDRNTANQADISVAVQASGESVTSLANGTYPLVPTTDYRFDGNKVTINKSYLAQLPIGTSTLTFTFSSGNTVSFTIHVVNTTPVPSQTIANVPALQLYSLAGVAPYLPSIVPVHFTDQTEKALPVTWGNVSPAQYASAGSFAVQGVITGTSVPVTANITVQSLDSAGAVTGGADLTSYLTNLPFQMPSFSLYSYPEHDFPIQDYGAVGDGVTKNTAAFAHAIAAAADAGGGRVIVPAGVWLTGPIQMKSNINLHLETGAKILFSPEYSDYTPGPTRYQPMLSASGLSNIAITGNGTIDGNGQYWRYVKKSKLTAGQWAYLLSLGGVVSEDGSQWYPSQQAVNVGRPIMVDVYNSTNVLIDGPTFMNSPQFATSFTSCQYLVIRNTTVNNDAWYQNGDGLDVTSSQHVVMYHNTVNAGDDGIGMKSSNDPSPANTLSNVVVADNIVFRGHGGLSIGSNTSGGINNMAVRNNQYIGTDNGINFKSYVGAGGPIQNIFIDGIHMQNIADTAISIDDFYKGHDPVLDKAQLGVDYRVPEFKNIHISHVTVDGASQAVYIDALPNVPVHDMDLNHVVIKAKKGWESTYTSNIQLNNVQIIPASGTVYTLKYATNFLFNQVLCPPGTSTFIHLQGNASGIVLHNTDLSSAGVPFLLDQGISQSAISILNPGTTPVPSPPTDVSALVGNTQVYLTWNAVSGADDYTVKRRSISGSAYQTIAAYLTGTAYLDTGLAADTYAYVVTAVNSGGESGPSNEVLAAMIPATAGLPVATFSGAGSSSVGQSFSYVYGLSGVTGSVYASVYAQDLLFRYNPAVLQFESAESLMSGVSVLSVHPDSSGSVRILLASTGTGMNKSGDIVKLTWRAVGAEQPGNVITPIYLSKAVIADGEGNESILANTLATIQLIINKSLLTGKITAAAALNAGSYTPSSWSVLQTYVQAANAVNVNALATQNQVDAAVTNLQTAMELLEAVSSKTGLQSKITEAEAVLASASIGERWGQYAPSAAAALRASVLDAKVVFNDPDADQAAADQAAADLGSALQAFLSTTNTNASIGDLAMISARYGITSSSTDWTAVQRYDVNQDNRLDIIDLAAVAKKILKE